MKIIISCCPGYNEAPFGPVKPKQSEDDALGKLFVGQTIVVEDSNSHWRDDLNAPV